VVMGMLTPVKLWLGHEGFVQQVQSNIDRLSKQSLGSVPSRDLAKDELQFPTIRSAETGAHRRGQR
jgi:hypothetical protein